MFQIDIVQKCKAQNRKAQLKLYRQYCEGMFLVAQRYVKNENDAEDVVQEAFVKAFKNLDQFVGEVTFGAWLKRIVINQCLDFLKVKKLKTSDLDENQTEESFDDDWHVTDDVSVEQVKMAIVKLPEKYRYVVIMYLLEGLDHSEISEFLNITGSASRTRLMRGKNLLKEMLKNKIYADEY